MNIWEKLYSRNKEGEKVLVSPQTEHNQDMSDSLSNPMEPAGATSFEEMYYRNSKAQSVNQNVQDRESQAHTFVKPTKSRFVPRRLSGKLSTPYPAILAKISRHLSDSWANIMLESNQSIRTLLVCGAARDEGSTFISFHLAMFLSKEWDIKVLYVDTSLHHTAIPKIQNLPGLYSFISEKKDLASLIVKTAYPGFYLLPSGAGKIAKNVSNDILAREPIETLIQYCQDNFDITIIDGQPLTSSPSMIEFARIVDRTALVCRYGYSRREVSKLAIERLQKFGITSIGVIFNDRRFPIPKKLYKWIG